MYAKIKRVLDFIVSLALLLLLWPVILLLVVVVYCSSKGNAFFVQERIGKGGKPFNIYKFRSMRINDEADGLPKLAETDDSRLTRVGRFLRAHHLDELPQLWNVVRGDMSFVGYRPERQYFIDKIMELRPDYARLFAIRPGITSMATVYNGYTGTMEKMLRRLDMDLEYLDSCSLATDLKVVWVTLWSIVSGKKI